MLGLRFAAEKLGQFDEAYANRAAKDMGGLYESPLKVMLGGMPLNSEVELDGDTRIKRAVEAAMLGGVYGTNVGYRYGLPAAGVTLAGKGLYDLTQAMSGPSTDGELPM